MKNYNVTGVLYFGLEKPRMYIRKLTIVAKDEADASEKVIEQYGGRWVNGPVVEKVKL